MVTSDIFEFTWELKQSPDSESLDLALQVTEMLVDVVVGFQLIIEVLPWTAAMDEKRSAVCEAYVGGVAPVDLGKSSLGEAKKPTLSVGSSFLFRNVPGRLPDHVPEAFLQRAVNFIEGCCLLDKRALERRQSTRVFEKMHTALTDVLNLLDTSEKLLQRGRTESITVQFHPEDYSDFVKLLAQTHAAVVQLSIMDSQLSTAAVAVILVNPNKAHLWREFYRRGATR